MPKSIDTTDLDISDDVMKELLSVDKEIWLEDVANQKEYFAQFGSRLPKEITEELEKLEANLKKYLIISLSRVSLLTCSGLVVMGSI